MWDGDEDKKEEEKRILKHGLMLYELGEFVTDGVYV